MNGTWLVGCDLTFNWCCAVLWNYRNRFAYSWFGLYHCLVPISAIEIRALIQGLAICHLSCLLQNAKFSHTVCVGERLKNKQFQALHLHRQKETKQHTTHEWMAFHSVPFQSCDTRDPHTHSEVLNRVDLPYWVPSKLINQYAVRNRFSFHIVHTSLGGSLVFVLSFSYPNILWMCSFKSELKTQAAFAYWLSNVCVCLCSNCQNN